MTMYKSNNSPLAVNLSGAGRASQPESSDCAADIAKLPMVPRHILKEIPRQRHSASRGRLSLSVNVRASEMKEAAN